jgi:RNA polymerase sigma-70 factor, ECF subfamily
LLQIGRGASRPNRPPLAAVAEQGFVAGAQSACATTRDNRAVQREAFGDVDDTSLIRSVAQGNERALKALYDRHAGWLLARLTRRCPSRELVDQALIDTFLTLWRQARRYRAEGDVGAFIWGIGRRRLLDGIRHDTVATRKVPVAWGRAGGAELVASAEEEVLLCIEEGRLGRAMTKLAPELRAALQATVLDGLTCVEAGRLLGVPVGTVKSRCYRARVELRAACGYW